VNSLRLWILVLAGTVFAAGLASGLFLAERRAAARPAPASSRAHSEVYRQLFEQTFPLSPERTQLFGELLARYDEEVEEVRQRALSASISEVEAELAALGLRYRDAIRNHVLPSDQRERFDQLAAQSTPPPARR
jgi:hypothetical protein